jgi:2-methylfumaryl-CoA isomerase
MFTPLDQPRIGTYLASGHPASFDGHHATVAPASAVGEDTAQVLRDWLGTPESDIAALHERGVVAG